MAKVGLVGLNVHTVQTKGRKESVRKKVTLGRHVVLLNFKRVTLITFLGGENILRRHIWLMALVESLSKPEKIYVQFTTTFY